MIDTVILDVDGTLVDSNYHHSIAWARAFGRYDLFPPLWRIHRAIGMGGDRLVAEVAGEVAEDEQGDALRDAWTTAEDAEESKPAADLLLAAIDRVHGSSGVMVGDATWDAQAARAAGLSS